MSDCLIGFMSKDMHIIDALLNIWQIFNDQQRAVSVSVYPLSDPAVHVPSQISDINPRSPEGVEPSYNNYIH